MAGSVDAVQVEEVWQMLTSLGYRNPSAEDIALTLQQVGQAHCREGRCAPTGKQADDFQQPSASPPLGLNDVTMPPYNDNDNDAKHSNEEAQEPSNEDNHHPHRNSASLKQYPGLSSHSMRGGRTTPMNSRGTGRQPRWCRVVESQPTREYRHQQPYHGGGGSVVVEGRLRQTGEGRQVRRNVDLGGPLNMGYRSAGATKEGVMISTATDPMGGVGVCRSRSLEAEHMNPQARLERHLKRYERGLKAFYTNMYNNDAQDEFLEERKVGEEEEEEEDYGENSGEEYLEDLDEGGCGRNLAVCYGGRAHHLVAPEMPLRPSRVVLHQRGANTIYSFTGDGRYKYRGGSGTPLCTVLGPDGSTLRRRSDPVRRGQQMREMWKNDKFLAQHGRKEDRWRVRQGMISWNP